MTLRPEQERALIYARKRGTESSISSIRSRVAATYSELESLVEGISPEILQKRPQPSSWSIQEVVDHLVESDTPAAAQLAELIAGRSVDSAIPAGLQSPHPLETPWPTLLSDFRSVHSRVVDLLQAASDDLLLTATAPVEMVVKCAAADGSVTPLHWVQRFDWKAFAILLHAHNREHIAQVQRILGSLTSSRTGG